MICGTNGTYGYDCTIRNISDGGAEISAKQTVAVGDQVFLLVIRTQLAYLSSGIWVQNDRFGVSFSQVHELGPQLAPNLMFLKHLLVQAKLSQMLSLVQKDIPLDEAASVVGWSDEEINRLLDVSPLDQKGEFVVQRTRQLFKK